jgi:hypothetical protein
MILSKADELISGNLLYNENIDRWKFLYNSYVGGQDYRDAAYLTRYQLESQTEYNARLNNTPLDNQCKGIISTYSSFLFRNEPEREYNSITNLPELESFLDDADLEGRSLNAFMKEAFNWAAVFGHSWIIMTKPNINATTRADEIVNDIRPYVSLLTPLTVLDWSWTRQPNGRYELDYFKYVEEINGDLHTIREWTNETITTSIVDKQRGVITQQPLVEDNQLGTISAVIVYSDRSITRGIGISTITDIADAQRFIYNAMSEADQSIRLDSHPSLVATPDTQVGTGAGSVIQIPENLDAGLKPYVLDFAGANINSIYTVIDKTVDAIEKMANVGGVRATETRSQSGVALETEFQLLNARLSAFADNLELAEEQIWKLFCLYQLQPFDVTVSYPDSFQIKDGQNEIQQLQMAKNAATDARILAAIDSKILDWLELDEDEITAMANPLLLDLEAIPEREYPIYKPIQMTDPVSGKMIMPSTADEQLQLSKQGWVEVE